MEKIYKIAFILLITLLELSIRVMTKCPEQCRCDRDDFNRKRVKCNEGDMTRIPTDDMDLDTQVIIIGPSPDGEGNKLRMGSMFNKFTYLEELRVTDSEVPSIGEKFAPGLEFLRILDLRRNKIKMLMDNGFRFLRRIETLHLDENGLETTTSSAFCNLTTLHTLTLSRNNLKLAVRLFYCVKNIKRLDLSHNEGLKLDVTLSTDLKNLTYLNLRDCGLTTIVSGFYNNLRKLKELDLQDNSFLSIVHDEFRGLRSLKILRLDGNRIKIIQKRAFKRHNLEYLGLSNNHLTTLPLPYFEDFSVLELDISGNDLRYLDLAFFGPLIQTLQGLHIGDTRMAQNTIKSILDVLTSLRKLSIRDSGLEELRVDMFTAQRRLQVLDLSGNEFSKLEPTILSPLFELRVLNLSRNEFNGLSDTLLKQFRQLVHLQKVVLSNNPWMCDLCYLVPLQDWMNTSIYRNRNCMSGPDYCARCAYPERLRGRDLRMITRHDLQYCSNPDPQASLMTTESQIGIIAAVAICVLIVAIILIIIFLYHHQGSYYTHEEDREATYINEAVGSYEHGTIDDRGSNGPLNGRTSSKGKIYNTKYIRH